MMSRAKRHVIRKLLNVLQKERALVSYHLRDRGNYARCESLGWYYAVVNKWTPRLHIMKAMLENEGQKQGSRVKMSENSAEDCIGSRPRKAKP